MLRPSGLDEVGGKILQRVHGFVGYGMRAVAFGIVAGLVAAFAGKDLLPHGSSASRLTILRPTAWRSSS